MYSIAKLQSLANDPDLVATVRQVVAELIIADRDPNTARRLMPLRGYGPNTPARCCGST